MDPASPVRFRDIAEPSLRRLPLYYRLLAGMRAEGREHVSSGLIARELCLDASQVRKDIESTGMAGKPRVGYPLAGLMDWIEDFLGWGMVHPAVLAGAGDLGRVLLGYEKLRATGLDIVAVFDNLAGGDPLPGGLRVQPLEELTESTLRLGAEIGLIALPAGVAQAAADAMLAGGVRAIWNFASLHLRVPAGIIVQTEDLYPSLATLSFRLERVLTGERRGAGGRAHQSVESREI